jgi:hypothetical protein
VEIESQAGRVADDNADLASALASMA